MTVLVRPVLRSFFWLRHQVFGRRYRRLILEQVQGVPFVVLPEVFNPGLFQTGPFLVQTLQKTWRAPVPPGQRALDMGTGSGLGAVFAARLGFRVVGVDISPEAVRCARINVLLNHLEQQVDVRQGDLFGPVAGERFDLVMFNPPFHRGEPRDWLDHAWRGTDVIERFAGGLRDYLNPGGRAFVVHSTDGEWRAMLAALQANGFDPQPAGRRDLGNEVLTVYRVSQVP